MFHSVHLRRDAAGAHGSLNFKSSPAAAAAAIMVTVSAVDHLPRASAASVTSAAAVSGCGLPVGPGSNSLR